MYMNTVCDNMLQYTLSIFITLSITLRKYFATFEYNGMHIVYSQFLVLQNYTELHLHHDSATLDDNNLLG
jgi:hypothetical protein